MADALFVIDEARTAKIQEDKPWLRECVPLPRALARPCGARLLTTPDS
jgi:hypothetical protein